MATRRTWSDVRRHAVREPQRIALSGEGWRLTYGDLVARVSAPGAEAPAGGVSVVAADRVGRAVIDVLTAQHRGQAALILPESTAPEYRRRAIDAVRAGSLDGEILASLDEGVLTTTSGSTGAPKIVVHDPAGVDRFVAWAQERLVIDSRTISLSLSPLNFDVAHLDVWAVLSAGGRVHVASAARLTDGAALGRVIDDEGVTLVQSVPSVLTLISGAPGVHDGVRVVVSTGDFFPDAGLPRLEVAFPEAERLSVYGSTETNDTFVNDLAAAVGGALGRPLPGVEHTVQDGELVVHSPYQALGYLGVETDSATDAWLLRSGRRWFRTGDGVERHDDGSLRLRGRIDRVRKVRGYRVSLDDTEASLRSHPHVADAIVIDTGDDEARVEAIVLPRPDRPTSSLVLRSWLAERLTTAAIPSRIWLTTTPFLRTTTGKTDRRATFRSLTAQESR